MKRLLKKINRNSTGFSLVEFIVIISIFAIMAGVALFNFGGFNSNVSLNNLAHDIALTVRQAQVYGISATEGADINPTSQIRGVYFPYLSSNFDNKFTIFLDVNTDPNNLNPLVTYDLGTDVDLDTVTITTQDSITNIEYGAPGVSTLPSCTSDFVIAFRRPNPTPLIFCGGTQASFARITVSNQDSVDKYIEIWPTGQIAVVGAPTQGGI